jgi:hypothetical protein
MPSSGYCREHGDDCPDLVIRADHPVTPEMVEILEISETDAAARRGNQLARKRKLREMRSSSKRYAAIALEKNMRIAAEKLAQQKLAAEKAAAVGAHNCLPLAIVGMSPLRILKSGAPSRLLLAGWFFSPTSTRSHPSPSPATIPERKRKTPSPN